MDLNTSLLHVGYRKSIATTPTCADKPRWYVEHGKHIELSKNPRLGHVLLIGDDFIESLALYPKVWTKYFGPLQSLNYGLHGDKTQHVLWRVENGSMPVNAETIVIHAGANNMLSDHSRDIANGIGCIALMCLKHKPNAKIVLAGLIPFNVNRKKKIRNVNRYLKLLCSSRHIPNSFYVNPDDDWLLPGGSPNKLLYRKGLSESGMDKFSKTISDVIITSQDCIKIEMSDGSDGSDVSSDEDTFLTRPNKINKTSELPQVIILDTTNRSHKRVSVTRKRKDSSSTNKSSTPSGLKSRSHSVKRSKSKDSHRKHSSISRKSVDHRSSPRPISPVITGERSRSRSRSRPISPVFTGKRSRSHCRSRSISSSRISERERWCERASIRLSGEVKTTDSFELKSTWSPSVSPSRRLSPAKKNSRENHKIFIAKPIKDEKHTFEMTTKIIAPPPEVPPALPPTLPEAVESVESVSKALPTLPDTEDGKTHHMYARFLKELETFNKKESVNPSSLPTNGNLNGN